MTAVFTRGTESLGACLAKYALEESGEEGVYLTSISVGA